MRNRKKLPPGRNIRTFWYIYIHYVLPLFLTIIDCNSYTLMTRQKIRWNDPSVGVRIYTHSKLLLELFYRFSNDNLFICIVVIINDFFVVHWCLLNNFDVNFKLFFGRLKLNDELQSLARTDLRLPGICSYHGYLHICFV